MLLMITVLNMMIKFLINPRADKHIRLKWPL